MLPSQGGVMSDHRRIQAGFGAAIAAIAAVALLVGCSTEAGSAGNNASKAPQSPKARGTANADGVFFVNCGFSHTANVDPILMPGMTNMSMLHDFFGNEATNGTSTPASLTNGSTTCSTTADSSAYWTPVLYANGHPLHATKMATYWHPASSDGPTPPLPANLEMIAGDEHATEPQPLSHIAWVCHDDSGPKGKRTRGPKTHTPHVCGQNQHIKEEITFPNCWDGTTSGTAIAPAHVVYPSADGACPTSHPTALLVLRINVFYPDPPTASTPASSTSWALSTGQGKEGSTDTAHADFMDGWNTAVVNRLISTCLDAHVKCGRANGPDGAVRTPRQSSGTGKEARPHKG